MSEVESKSLTGYWVLDLSKTSSQKEFLKALGRKPWEISVIDKANENFGLFHFVKKVETTDLHFFEKFVLIYLDSVVLRTLTKMSNAVSNAIHTDAIEFDKVKYSHRLTANRKEVTHDDDEKRFGPCSSVTSWDSQIVDNKSRDGFTIRWRIPGKGLLTVFHFVNDLDELQVEMKLVHPSGSVHTTRKIYRRSQSFPADLEASLKSHKFKEFLI